MKYLIQLIVTLNLMCAFIALNHAFQQESGWITLLFLGVAVINLFPAIGNLKAFLKLD
jgi:hypothetical protein